MKPERVALISSSYFPHTGGVEEHVRSVAAELVRRGHAVRVWTVDRGEHLGTRMVDGVEVRYLPTPLPTRSLRGLVAFWVRLPWAMARWLLAWVTFRPAILHVHCYGPNGVYATALSRLVRRPLVLSSHGETFMDARSIFDQSALMRKALADSLRQADVVTGCSLVVVDDLTQRFGPVDADVVPNGVDLERAGPAREKTSPPVVFAVGRLEEVKGFDLLLRAFAEADLSPEVRLTIGGNGSAFGALSALTEELGLGTRVSMPGMLDSDEVADQMAKASLVVVPSRKEAFGIVVLEAWRAGSAMIVTSHGGPASIVTDGQDGVVVDPENISDLAESMTALMTSPHERERLSAAGLMSVRSYSWAGVVERYEALYEGLRK